MASKKIWMSYDLGVRGDYEGLYRWLDTHSAMECGDAVAYITYSYNKSFIDELKSDLKDCVDLDKKARVYIIYPEAGKHKGTFIFGKRRGAPWAGFAPSESEEVDEGQ